ncbi:MAG: NifB/NifX family molybdenum-iron cluster-binding protein [Candidatus Hadarchaeota archaeon]
MKVAVTAEGKSLESKVSPIFGRCQCFVTAKLEDGEIEKVEGEENLAASNSSGAGTAAAQRIGDKGAEALITGGVGPKAFSALKKWNIEVFRGEPGTVKENIEKLDSGELEKFESPSVEAHMGMEENM